MIHTDQAVYGEMARRGSRGSWLWLAGSLLRTAGLAGVIIVLLLWPVMFYYRMGDMAVLFAALLLVTLALFALGSALRSVSCRIAAAEGMDISSILKRAAGGERPGGGDGN